MHTKSLSTFAIAFVVGLCLAGCAQKSVLPDRNLGHGWTLERKVIKALSRVQASSDQRKAVFAAYDRINPTLKRLSDESTRLQAMWATLDAKSADFTDRSEHLIGQRAEIYQVLLKVEANFDHSIAEVLTPQQWRVWKNFLRENEPKTRSRGSKDGGGKRRRASHDSRNPKPLSHETYR